MTGWKKRACALVCATFFFALANAQDDEGALLVAGAMYVSGASDAEQLDESLLERLESLRRSPVGINYSSASRLLSSGLFSPYQVASLEDYRSRSGDVTSFSELALVDGFSSETVAAIAPFIDLGRAPPGADTLRHSGVARVAVNGYGVKYKAVSGDLLQLSGALKGGWGGKIGSWTAAASLNLRRWRFLAGDFNARYGQGLVLWSGFRITTPSTPDALVLRGGGLSPSWSYASYMRGAATEWSSGGLRASAFATFSRTAGANVSYLSRRGQCGLTALWDGSAFRLSSDGRYNIRGVDLFWEGAASAAGGGAAGDSAAEGSAAGKRSAAAVAGASFIMVEGLRATVRLKAVPSAFSGVKYGDYAVAGGMTFVSDGYVQLKGLSGSGSSARRLVSTLTAEGSLLPVPSTGETSRKQLRIISQTTLQASGTTSLAFRLGGRYRSYDSPRTDLRLDAGWSDGRWILRGRTEAVLVEKAGFLGYLEAGMKAPLGYWYARVTGVFTPSWAERIYCYERDAPGNFSVPAYYGRGLSLSGIACLKFHLRHRLRISLYLKASYGHFAGRDDKFDGRLQLNLSY